LLAQTDSSIGIGRERSLAAPPKAVRRLRLGLNNEAGCWRSAGDGKFYALIHQRLGRAYGNARLRQAFA
jgi:hypothetical protein